MNLLLAKYVPQIKNKTPKIILANILLILKLQDKAMKNEKLHDIQFHTFMYVY